MKPHTLANAKQGELPKFIQNLIADLPDSVILQTDAAGFQQALDVSWAQQNREIIPACFVRPRDAHQLSKAVEILKREHDERRNKEGESKSGFFAVRSGGVNVALGAATVQDGVVIDLSLLSEVTPSPDGSTVTVGTGGRWPDVYKTLEDKGLIVMGGRSPPVGVGGLTLQGGISFYSPRHGFVCSNVFSYEVVLADGRIVTASESEHPDLWRVLKGGANNFGIVTKFTLRSFPSAPLWIGRIYTPAIFQHAKGRKAFHSYVQSASSPEGFDENAAGPILSFTYVQVIRSQVMTLHLAYTKPAAEQAKTKTWPAHWKNTGFPSIFSLYSVNKVMSHGAAIQDLGSAGRTHTRHVQGTTTIRNDLETITLAYEIFSRTASKLSCVKGMLFPFTIQAILPAWMNKGFPNVLGLEGCTEPLIILSASVSWEKEKDDDLVRGAVKEMLGEIERAAEGKGTGHPYRFMNYSMEWQKVYEGGGEESLRIMREAGGKYDPDGLFQTGCAGGFKIGRD